MPALPSVVSDYLTAVKDSLKQGSDLGSNVRGAARNYLRAQDLATVIELLENGLDTGSLTATALGSTTTVVDGAATFVAGQQVGNIVVFDGNTTPAIAGEQRVIVSNTATTLTFSPALPGSPTTGDTYSILWTRRGATAVEALRQGKGLAEAPPGNVHGDALVAIDALYRILQHVGGSLAGGLSVSEMISRARFDVGAGAQPGQNAMLAELIQQVEDAVVAYTLPT